MESLEDKNSGVVPFNSRLETGIRALVVLEAFYPRHCDLLEMTWFDHLVVHTGDLAGQDVPESLHPDLPNRTGELFVRRQLVEQSLRMMHEMHLIEVLETENGIEFCASEAAPSYLDLLQTPYSLALKQRAKWMAERFSAFTAEDIRSLVEMQIGRWTAEFRAIKALTGQSS